MKPNPTADLSAAVLALLVGLGVPGLVFGQDIPAVINYQGKLTDSAGKALTNGQYVIDFRIWDHPTSTNSADYVWGRQFPLWVGSNGLFNVLLSNDGGTLTSPNPNGQVSSLLYAFDKPDRFLGLSIRQVPGGTLQSSAPEISPRQQFASAPYAMHAQQASAAASANFAATATNALNFATYSTNDFLMAKRPNQTLTGSLTITGGTLTVSSNIVGNGTIPIGGIIMWSGNVTAIPSGWALCDGQIHNNQTTPDLRDRFIVGAGNSYAVKAIGGAQNVTLAVTNLPAHNHTYTDTYFQEKHNDWHSGGDSSPGDGTGGNTSTNRTTADTGLGTPFDIRPPYYALAFIMRVQ